MEDLIKHILLIDDSPDFREIFSMKLSASGFKIETASNGTEGILKAKELRPDLILLDMLMPGLSGMETLEKLKEFPETKDSKVLFLTSLGDPQEAAMETDEKISKDVGAAGYLRKTDDLDLLVAKIKTFLG